MAKLVDARDSKSRDGDIMSVRFRPLVPNNIHKFDICLAAKVNMDGECIFCRIIAGEVSTTVIFETPQCLVIKDIAPQAPLHYLILPKKHVESLYSCTIEDGNRLAQMMLIPKKLATMAQIQDFTIITNSGYAAGQRIFHLHFHFMAG